MAGSRSTAPLNRSNSVFIDAQARACFTVRLIDRRSNIGENLSAPMARKLPNPPPIEPREFRSPEEIDAAVARLERRVKGGGAARRPWLLHNLHSGARNRHERRAGDDTGSVRPELAGVRGAQVPQNVVRCRVYRHGRLTHQDALARAKYLCTGVAASKILADSQCRI